MLAAVTGLAYTAGSLLKVESYMAYLLPLPVILAALRSGPLPALKTLTTACLLLLGAPTPTLGGQNVQGGGEGAAHVCRVRVRGWRVCSTIYCSPSSPVATTPRLHPVSAAASAAAQC